MEDTIVEFFAILIIIIFHFQEWNKKINKKWLKTVIWATLYKAQWEEHCFFFKETKGSLVWFEHTCGNFFQSNNTFNTYWYKFICQCFNSGTKNYIDYVKITVLNQNLIESWISRYFKVSKRRGYIFNGGITEASIAGTTI